MKLPFPKSFAETLQELAQAPDISIIIKDLIDADLSSEEKRAAFQGLEYYNGDHLITSKQRFFYDRHKEKHIDVTKTNNKPVNNFHADFVDEKVFYVAGKNPRFMASDDRLQQRLDEVIDLDFYVLLKRAIEGASNKGSEFIYAYADDEGAYKYTIMPREELIVIRDGSIEDKITEIVRYYLIDFVTAKTTSSRYRVEWYRPDGVVYYVQNEAGEYELDENEPINPKPSYISRRREVDGNVLFSQGLLWGDPPTLPFIEIKNNHRRTTDLARIKTLIDAYNAIEAGFLDNISDTQEVLTVIKGALGEDLATVQDNLRFHKLALFDEDGGISAVEISIPVEARETALKRLYRDIHHFGKAVLMDPEKYSQSPSGVALKFMYSRLDMKADDVISSLKTALQKFVKLFALYEEQISGTTYEDLSVEWIFNKSQVINELEKVSACQASKGLISDQTIIVNHPFVNDYEAEIERIEQERETLIDLGDPDPIQDPASKNGALNNGR